METQFPAFYRSEGSLLRLARDTHICHLPRSASLDGIRRFVRDKSWPGFWLHRFSTKKQSDGLWRIVVFVRAISQT